MSYTEHVRFDHRAKFSLPAKRVPSKQTYNALRY
jgi:hypothetical protein